MAIRHGGYQPGTPPREPAGASSANPITYEHLQMSFVLGRGVVIDNAPEHAKIAIGLLTAGHFGLDLGHPGHIKFAYQVEYEITGYDPADCTLTLHLVHDWRPGQKDDPHAEPTDDLDITPYLVVHRYRTDRGDWAWAWRCWGDGTCDGHLALDLASRDYAERKAREHLATEHPADAPAKEN
jgi:hypothetical protein